MNQTSKLLPCSGMRLRNPALAIMLLCALFAFFLILTPIVTSLMARTGIRYEALVRLGMIIQDLFVFILPAMIAAILSTKLPARLLGVDSIPSGKITALAVITLFCSMPAMNLIVEWNDGMHFPESMVALETQMRAMEDAAQQTIDTLMDGAGVGSLLVSVLIIGVLAGFSEELFFRGGLLRTVMCTRINGHAAVWLVALIFSVLHFQFYGFIPRMLLGAFFGYVLWWSGSLWLPVFLHVLNNSIVVYMTWRKANAPSEAIEGIEKIGTNMGSGADICLVCLSVTVTAWLFWQMWRSRRQQVCV